MLSRSSAARAVEAPRDPRRTPKEAGGEQVLVIDDDRAVGTVVHALLQAEGYRPVYVESAEEGLQLARSSDFSLLITDLRLRGASGLDVIRRLKADSPGLPAILMTSFSSIDSAIEALRNGAVDYIIKPFDNDDFIHSVDRALQERRMQRENGLLRKRIRKAYAGRSIIGDSAGIKRVIELIGRVAPSDASVLIQGESGTGKELVAQAIHNESGRADGLFVPVNCGAIPTELIESELFGHVKGAFTGATGSTEGLIREANGGTLFLDEISELPINLQVKLLRVLQEREVRPVGSRELFRVDARIVAASNKNLKAAVERGTFREDLYYRLNVIEIVVPPLRERGKDVQLLAPRFIEQYSRKLGKRIRGTTGQFDAFLLSYHWPGNVRELQNVIERAVILADSDVIGCSGVVEPEPAPQLDRIDNPLTLEDYIRQVVLRFQATHSEIEIARMLGIGRKALWMRRRRWGLTRDAAPDADEETPQ